MAGVPQNDFIWVYMGSFLLKIPRVYRIFAVKEWGRVIAPEVASIRC